MTGDGCDESNIEQLDLKSLMDLKPRKKHPSDRSNFHLGDVQKDSPELFIVGYVGMLWRFIWVYMDLCGFIWI